MVLLDNDDDEDVDSTDGEERVLEVDGERATLIVSVKDGDLLPREVAEDAAKFKNDLDDSKGGFAPAGQVRRLP